MRRGIQRALTVGAALVLGLLTGHDPVTEVSLGAPNACAIGEPCYDETWQQPQPQNLMKLDITFFIDTSKSLNPERNAVADKIDALVGAFPKGLDYRMGVILSHGYDSAWGGRYYQKGQEPKILNSKTMSVATIRAHLKKKFTDPIWHRPSAGEAGLHALYLAVNDAPGYKYLTKNRADGMFRPDAGQVFIFISDENDICATYPAGVTPVSDAPDNVEAPAYGKYCAPGGNLPKLQEEYVWKYVLRQLGPQTKMLFSALVHTTPVPPNPADPLSQDEYGYGYMELIRISQGIAVDIDDPDYRPGLQTLGGLAASLVTLQKEFLLAHAPVDPSTIVVKVDGQVTPNWTFDATKNVVTVADPGQAGSKIAIAYCERSKLPPTFFTITPENGSESGGTLVTIRGADFQGGVTATLGGVACSKMQFVSRSELKCTTGAHAPGFVDLVITNPDGQSTTGLNAYQYLRDPPVVISVTPNEGPTTGGQIVAVNGKNFDNGATVELGGVPCQSVTFLSPTQLGCMTPPRAAGRVNVTVKNLDGKTSTLVNGYLYRAPPPSVISVTPRAGTVAGGTKVTIAGAQFQPGATVALGTAACTGVTVDSSGTSLSCTTTAHPASTVDVKVTNPDAQSATLPRGYTYQEEDCGPAGC